MLNAGGFLDNRPLLGMLVLGAIVFAAAWLLAPPPRERIDVDARTAASVIERRADALGRPLTADEEREAVDAYVDEEILIREAFRSGRHLTNGTARARLAGMMRLAMASEVPAPTQVQLRAYYAAHPERYRNPETISFEHVFYSRDRSASEIQDPRPRIEAGANASALGDPFWMGGRLEDQTEAQLAAALGSDFAGQVFDLPTDEWSGPVSSNRGTHFVLVLERQPPTVLEFSRIVGRVELDWLSDRRAEVADRKIERMAARYDIRVEAE